MSLQLVDFSLVKSLPGLFWALCSGAWASDKLINSSLERGSGLLLQAFVLLWRRAWLLEVAWIMVKEMLKDLCLYVHFLLLFELVSPSIAKDSMRLMKETRLFLNLRFLMKWFQRSQVSLTYLSPSEPDPAWQTNEASPFFWKAVPVKCSTDQEVPPILLRMICCKKALGLKVEFFVTRACSQSPV